MTIAVKLLLTVALIFSIAVPFGAFAAGEKTKGRYKTALAANTVMFFGTMLFAVCVLFGGTAFAAESTAAAVDSAANAVPPKSTQTAKSMVPKNITVLAARAVL